jgi:hypothetical protein
MPRGLRRYYGHGHRHFITFSCYQRLPLQSVKRGLAPHPAHWPRSSYHFYAKREPVLIPIDV